MAYVGTGSGSLSTAFIRSLAPHGHLYTFEFNKHRADVARYGSALSSLEVILIANCGLDRSVEFERNGLSRFVTVTRGDACQDGFGDQVSPCEPGFCYSSFIVTC